MTILRELVEEFLYPLALFIWIAWYWLLPLSIVIGLTLAFVAGLTLGH
jgi:hypothetical protein